MAERTSTVSITVVVSNDVEFCGNIVYAYILGITQAAAINTKHQSLRKSSHSPARIRVELCRCGPSSETHQGPTLFARSEVPARHPTRVAGPRRQRCTIAATLFAV